MTQNFKFNWHKNESSNERSREVYLDEVGLIRIYECLAAAAIVNDNDLISLEVLFKLVADAEQKYGVRKRIFENEIFLNSELIGSIRNRGAITVVSKINVREIFKNIDTDEMVRYEDLFVWIDDIQKLNKSLHLNIDIDSAKNFISKIECTPVSSHFIVKDYLILSFDCV